MNITKNNSFFVNMNEWATVNNTSKRNILASFGAEICVIVGFTNSKIATIALVHFDFTIVNNQNHLNNIFNNILEKINPNKNTKINIYMATNNISKENLILRQVEKKIEELKNQDKVIVVEKNKSPMLAIDAKNGQRLYNFDRNHLYVRGGGLNSSTHLTPNWSTNSIYDGTIECEQIVFQEENLKFIEPKEFLWSFENWNNQQYDILGIKKIAEKFIFNDKLINEEIKKKIWQSVANDIPDDANIKIKNFYFNKLKKNNLEKYQKEIQENKEKRYYEKSKTIKKYKDFCKEQAIDNYDIDSFNNYLLTLNVHNIDISNIVTTSTSSQEDTSGMSEYLQQNQPQEEEQFQFSQ